MYINFSHFLRNNAFTFDLNNLLIFAVLTQQRGAELLTTTKVSPNTHFRIKTAHTHA